MAQVISATVTCSTYIRARAVIDYSGTSATASIQYYHTAGGYTGYTGSFTYGAGSASASGSWNNETVGTQWTTKMTIPFSISTSGGTYRVWCSGYSYNAFSVDVTIPAQVSAPTQLTASNITPNVDGFSATVSVTGWGNDGGYTDIQEPYRELQCWTYSSTGLVEPRRYQASPGATLSSTIRVNNASSGSLSIQPNTRYVVGVYATNKARDHGGNTGSQRVGDYTTLPPTHTGITNNDTGTYTIYNKVKVSMTVSYPADGNRYSKTIQYRIRKGSGSWGSWTTATQVSSGSAGTRTFDITNLDTNTSYTVESRSSTTAGVSPSTASVTFTTRAEHQPPIFSNFDFYDTNSTTRSLLGDDSYAVQGKSNIRAEVKVADKAEPSDQAASIQKYKFIFDNRTLEADYSSSQTVYVVFNTPQIGDNIQTQAIDSLGGATSVSKSITLLPYSAPQVELTATRTDDSGASQVGIAGTYSPLMVEGVAKNTLTGQYRLLSGSTVLVDWTSVSLITTEDGYEGLIPNLPTTYTGEYLVEVKVQDALSETIETAQISAFNDSRVLKPIQWGVEVWSRAGTFLADISRFVDGDVSMSWSLNDIEDVGFSVSLDGIETLQEMGVSVYELLLPYANDIKIKRNGKYLLGCQIVEANVNISGESTSKISVKGTGYLNIFKDQYVSIPLGKYSYPVMAHRLIFWGQSVDGLIKNPTGDIDASYWLSPVGTISQTTTSLQGAGAIQCYATGTGWTTMGTQMKVPSGVSVNYDIYVSGAVGQVYLRERELIANSSTQRTIGTHTLSTASTYTHLTGTFTTGYEDGYFVIEQQQRGTPLRVDDCWVSRANETYGTNNQYVGCLYHTNYAGATGTNNASSGYSSNREFDYDLQNVKDAIIELTNLGEDNFDFEFTPDKLFNTYARKGEDRTDIEICFPGNADSIQINRSASNLANKIREIGSGIGDERLEVAVFDDTSRTLYGNRESIVTSNNTSQEEVLEGLARGELEKRGSIRPELTATISDGSINSGNIQTGDSIMFRTDVYRGVIGNQSDIVSNVFVTDGVYRLTCIKNNQLYALTADPETDPSYEFRRVYYAPLDTSNPFQQWRVINLGASDGFYPYCKIESCGLPSEEYRIRRMLDVREAVFQAGTEIQTWQDNGSHSQYWRFFMQNGTQATLQAWDTSLSLGANSQDDAVLTSTTPEVFSLQKISAPTRMSILESCEGWYRVKKIQAKISQDDKETISLSLEYQRGLDA